MENIRTLPVVPIDMVYLEAAGAKAGVWRVLHRDGTVLFEANEESTARSRLNALCDMAKVRLSAGLEVTGSDLLTLFPPTAPAPLVMCALSADELQREDVFDSLSRTWTMRNVEIFRSGAALKRDADGWKQIHFVPDDTRNLVEAYAALGWTPPVKVTHGSDQAIVLGELPSIARISALRAARVTDPNGEEQLGAFADLEKVPDVLREHVRAGRLHGRSIEFWRDQIPRTDGKDGKFPLVLKAVALLGAELPAVRGMPPLDVAPEKFSVTGSVTETLSQEIPQMDPKKGDVVEIPTAEYEKQKQTLETLSAESARQKTELERLAATNARLMADRRVEASTSAASRLRESGKITPAQEQNLVELLKTLDDEKSDAVTVVTLGTDGKTAESKKSQRGALVSFLDSMPKQTGAPGTPSTRGVGRVPQGPGAKSDFEALSAQQKDSAVYALWKQRCNEQKIDDLNSAKGHAAYNKAREDLMSGNAAIPEEVV